MDSAVLGGVGTLVGVIAGGFGTYMTTSRTTAKTLRVQTENTLRQLDAAHAQNLQDLQAPAYEQAAAAIKHRRDTREHELSPVRWDKRTENVIVSTLDGYTPPNWYESQSRLDLYASHAVLDANEVANDAHQKVLGLTREMMDLREAVEATEPTDREARVAFGVKHAELFGKIQAALSEAATADANLIRLMRTGVHARPSQYLSELPAR
jgi:hypothetical protein